jgi:hypothetical protein
MRWSRSLVGVFFILILGVSCSDTLVEPVADAADAADVPAFKVEKIHSRFSHIYDAGTATYLDCLGENVLWMGTIDVIWTEWTSASGNFHASWKLDYWDTPDVEWLEGEDSATIWTLVRAENKGTGWLVNISGKDYMHYQSNEWFENAAGEMIKMRSRGRFMFDDGDPKLVLDEVWGQCK